MIGNSIFGNSILGDSGDSNSSIIHLDYAKSRALAYDMFIQYFVEGVPQIIVNRNNTTALIQIINRDNNEIRIYRGDDYEAFFYQLIDIGDDEYLDIDLDENKNYKYKASFIINGIINDEPVVGISQQSDVVHTISPFKIV